jgi:hypothetical protein
MRTPISIFVFAIICLSTTSFAQHVGGESHGGNISAAHASTRRTSARPGNRSVFPAYRPRPVTAGHPAPIATHEDHIGNRVSDDHLRRVQFAHERSSTVMRTSPMVTNRVAYHGAAFTSTLHPIYQRKQVVFNEQFNRYHNVIMEHPRVWHDWHEHYFYGGFYYGFHPVPDMSIYFYNPLVHWFYIGTWDDAYYRTWYGPEYDAYPQLNRPFAYYGVYYPTDNLRQLLFGVSAMPVDKQARFRAGMITFTQKVTQALANNLHAHVVLANGDIAVTHYETLGQDDGVDLEGAVTYNGTPFDFKGLINLNQDSTVQVFLAGDETSEPSSTQLKSLDSLNHSMDELRGEAEAATPEATPSALPATATSGEVSADPQ